MKKCKCGGDIEPDGGWCYKCGEFEGAEFKQVPASIPPAPLATNEPCYRIIARTGREHLNTAYPISKVCHVVKILIEGGTTEIYLRKAK